MRHNILFTLLSLLFFLLACDNTEKSRWLNEANGIWKYSVGNSDEINLLSASKAKPNFLKLNEFDPIDFPFNTEDIKIIGRDNKIHILYSYLRVGAPNMQIDNVSCGGVFICLNQEGIFAGHGMT